MAARGAFDPDRKSQVMIVILAEQEILPAGGRPAIEQIYGKAPDAERIPQAADGTRPQAELLKCL